MSNKYVIISVYNKNNLEKIVPTLDKLGYKIIATAGTGKILKSLNINFIKASKVTKNPNALYDCIQTISYFIYGGILFNRNNQDHVKQIKKLNIKPIDIVICNFPPLNEIVKTQNDFNIQHVDVGGPLMVRSAATNYKQVLPLIDCNDYEVVASKLTNKNTIDEKLRKKLAIKAYDYCAQYDSQIVDLLSSY